MEIGGLWGNRRRCLSVLLVRRLQGTLPLSLPLSIIGPASYTAVGMFVPSYDLSCICDSTLSFKGQRGGRERAARNYVRRYLIISIIFLCQWSPQLRVQIAADICLDISLIHKTVRPASEVRQLPGFDFHSFAIECAHSLSRSHSFSVCPTHSLLLSLWS